MQPALRFRPVPYRFESLPSLTRGEVLLWNWYSRVGPSGIEWKAWIADVIGHLFERPAGQQLQLLQKHLVDGQFGEKILSFGSKQELSIGRDSANDVVLSAKAIADKHTRIFSRDGELYLEDLGGRLGTYVWEKRIQPNALERLSNGDQFTVFPYQFRVLLEQCWTPETELSLDQAHVQPLSGTDFCRMSPAGWRIFAVNTHPAGQQALLEVSPAFIAQLQQRVVGPLGVNRPNDAVPSDDALLGFMVLAVLERLNRRLKFPVQFSLAKATSAAVAGTARGMQISFAVGLAGLTGQFRIFLPLAFLSPGKPDEVAAPAANHPAGLSWNFPVSVGFVDLSPEEITQVGPGDALVLQRAAATLFPNDFSKGWAMTANGSNFTAFKLDKYFERGARVDTGVELTMVSGKPAVETLPLRLHVVLGEKEFTLAEVQSLSPGTIIELETTKSDPVRLMVNGKMLGEGELVDVEGSLAVRVLRWRST